MASAVGLMIREAVNAFRIRDPIQALAVIASDDQIDADNAG
jgi:hypothetical protein